MAVTNIPSENTDVVVIGAGVSGKIAAIESYDRGLSPVIVEKNLRAEGRLHTVEHAGRFFDGGAHMIHGGPDNEVGEWLRKNVTPEILAKFGVNRFDDLIVEDALNKLWTINGDGSAVRSAAFRSEGMEAVRDAFWAHQNGNSDSDLSLADAVKLVPGDKRDVAERYAKLASSMWQGTTAENVSLLELLGPPPDETAGSGSSGIARNVDWVVKGGLGRLFNMVADDMLAQRGIQVHTGQDVKVVRQTDNGFAVETANGKIFHGSMVNVTAPFGALKHIQFEPGLPQDIQNRILTTPMGNLVKIQVAFETGTLAERGIQEQQRVYSFEHPVAGHFFATISTYNDTIDFYGRDLGKLGIEDARKLVSGFTGAFKELQGLDKKMVADPKITDPSQNGNWGGSYPVANVGGLLPGKIGVAGNGGILFAGDGWTECDPGTIVGAFVSGQDAACRNDEHLRAQPKPSTPGF